MPQTAKTVLASWKEIAAYLGKGVRTAQRWEQDMGLPVRRPYAHNQRTVIAVRADIDAWLRQQLPRAESSGRNHACEHTRDLRCNLRKMLDTFHQLRIDTQRLTEKALSLVGPRQPTKP